VATEPPEVTTWTLVSLIGTVVVVVPPLEVRTPETTGELATETLTVSPWELTMLTVLGVELTDGDETDGDDETDGELTTKLEAETV
jgi:hypothetical protein